LGRASTSRSFSVAHSAIDGEAGRDGRFEPREIELGPIADGWAAVLDGVAAGEQVVTSANFLVDSESRLRAAVASFGADAPHAHH